MDSVPTIALLEILLLFSSGCAAPDASGPASDRLVATTWGKVDSVAFNADGTRAAYFTMKDERHWVVLGDWTSPAFDFISVYRPCLSADGRTVGFVATRDGHEALYRNGTPLFEYSAEWARRSAPVVSPDGSVVAALAGNDHATALVVNGRIGKIHAAPADAWDLVGNGAHFAFMLKVGEKQCVVVDDIPGPLYDWIEYLTLSEDGGTVAYMAGASGGTFVVHGPQVTSASPNICGTFLSRDGKKLGLVVWDDPERSSSHVQVEGRVGPKMGVVGYPEFSPDGEHVMYLATGVDHQGCLVIDDRVFKGDAQWATSPRFLNGGKIVGYATQAGPYLRWKMLIVD